MDEKDCERTLSSEMKRDCSLMNEDRHISVENLNENQYSNHNSDKIIENLNDKQDSMIIDGSDPLNTSLNPSTVENYSTFSDTLQTVSCSTYISDIDNKFDVKDSENGFVNENKQVPSETSYPVQDSSFDKQDSDNACVNKDKEATETTLPVQRHSLILENIKIIAGSWTEFIPKKEGHEIFLKGCKWSPDGTCLLTNSDDCIMRLFDLPLELYNCQLLQKSSFPELTPAVHRKVGGTVYDYEWYPLMTSTYPESCCFVTTSFSAPVQMWDAFSGTLRCSYKGFNLQDELHAALSVTFHPSGDTLFCGYKDNIKIFNTNVPGRDYVTLSTKHLCEQRGIISCIAVNPGMPSVFAAGSYMKTVGLYTVDGHGMCLLNGQMGGLTQLMFSEDGSRLYTAGRKDSEILCWDIRQLGEILYVMKRPHNTNQRIYFDLSADGNYLLSGSSDGYVRVWDLKAAPTSDPDSGNNVLNPVTQWIAHNDCVNGLSTHRHIPVVATASGQRYIPRENPNCSDKDDDEDDDNIFEVDRPKGLYEDNIKLWWAGPSSKEINEDDQNLNNDPGP